MPDDELAKARVVEIPSGGGGKPEKFILAVVASEKTMKPRRSNDPVGRQVDQLYISYRFTDRSGETWQVYKYPETEKQTFPETLTLLQLFTFNRQTGKIARLLEEPKMIRPPERLSVSLD